MTILTVEGTGTKIQGLKVSGHAGYAQSGRDIVCAAVSVLVTTGVNALESVSGVVPEVFQDESVAVISLALPRALDGQAEHDAQIILRTILQGFEDIAQEYPKYLKIIDGRKSSC